MPWSRIILLGHKYLDNHVYSILFAITSVDLVLIAVISNQPVAGLIMVNACNVSVWLFDCLKDYGPMKLTQSVSHGFTLASLAGKFLYLVFLLLVNQHV